MPRGLRADGAPARAEIEDAWRRAELSGLTPSSALRVRPGEVDPDSRLLLAARPVLDQMTAQLEGTPYCLVLADRDARVVERRFAQPALEADLDDVCLVPGAQYSEQVAGTTAIGTVQELRRGITITGEEHFIDALKDFACYGHPIVDPLTRRLEGVLDITGLVSDSNDLFTPFLTSAAHAVEQRLLLGARATQQALLVAFQLACARSSGLVLVVGEGVSLSNPEASLALGSQDHAVLRAMSAAMSGRTAREVLELASGRTAVVELEPVPGSGDGVLLRVAPVEPARQVAVPGPPRAPRPRSGTAMVVGRGEPGSGKTHWARERAGSPVTVLDGADDLPWAAWARILRDPGGSAVILDNVHLLPPQNLARLRHLLRSRSGRTLVVATTAAGGPGDPELAALLTVFGSVTDIPPLRDRPGDLPVIAAQMLAEADPVGERALSPELLAVLLTQPWPGNLSELRRLLGELAATGRSPTLTPEDLPAARRGGRGGRARTPLEEAEYRAIVAALRDCSGNKVHAARQLGISRATLYSKIRMFKIGA